MMQWTPSQPNPAGGTASVSAPTGPAATPIDPLAALDIAAITVGDAAGSYEPADFIDEVEPTAGQPGPAVWGETSGSFAAGTPLTADDLEAALGMLTGEPVPPATVASPATSDDLEAGRGLRPGDPAPSPIPKPSAGETAAPAANPGLLDDAALERLLLDEPSFATAPPEGIVAPDASGPRSGRIGTVRKLSASAQPPPAAEAAAAAGGGAKAPPGGARSAVSVRANQRAIATGAAQRMEEAPEPAQSEAVPGPNLGWLQTAPTPRSRWTDELKLPRRLPTSAALSPELLSRPAAALQRTRAAIGTLTIEVLLFAVVSRFVLAGISWLSLRAFERLDRYPGQLPDSFFPTHAALDGWARWDAAHYVAIAGHGYSGANPSPGDGAGFLPLYPALMRGAVELFGQPPNPAALAIAGLVIANLAFLLAVPLLAHLTAARFGEAAGRNAALLLCVSPFSFFFSAVYSESLFLLLSLISLTLAGRRSWAWAAVAAGLASGTRLAGLALTPALFVQARRDRADREDFPLIALLAPGGAVLYFFYCAIAFGDPFAYFRAQATWGGWREHVRAYVDLFVTRPGEALSGDPRHLVILLNLALAVVALALLPSVWRQLGSAVAIFTILIVVGHSLVTWVSLGRYMLPAVGLYAVAGAILGHPRLAGWPRDAILVGSTLLLGVLTVLFSHGFWVV